MEQARTVGIPAVMRPVEEPKWRALRTIAFLLKALAWLIFASSIVSSTLVIIMGVHMPLTVSGIPFLTSIPIPATLLGSLIVAIITIIAALLAFLILFAMSELILLLIMIERNTRSRY
jgi:hypothetical protein